MCYSFPFFLSLYLTIESGSALSVLLSTTIFVITLVKMLCVSWVHNKFWPLWRRISLSIKSTDNAEPLSICLPQYLTPNKVFISERDQNHDSKKEQALSITFSQYDWYISQNGRSWLAITLRAKMTRAWRVQRCLHTHRQRQISQSDCVITSNCGKKKLKRLQSRLTTIHYQNET